MACGIHGSKSPYLSSLPLDYYKISKLSSTAPYLNDVVVISFFNLGLSCALTCPLCLGHGVAWDPDSNYDRTQRAQSSLKSSTKTETCSSFTKTGACSAENPDDVDESGKIQETLLPVLLQTYSDVSLLSDPHPGYR